MKSKNHSFKKNLKNSYFGEGPNGGESKTQFRRRAEALEDEDGYSKPTHLAVMQVDDSVGRFEIDHGFIIVWFQARQ